MRKADFGPRFAAWFIDSLVAFPAYFLYIVPGILLFAFRDSLTKDQSFGRKATETRLVLAATGALPPAGHKFVRNLVALLLRVWTFGAYLLADLLVHLSRTDGRSLTDLMFGTMVISTRADRPFPPGPQQHAQGSDLRSRFAAGDLDAMTDAHLQAIQYMFVNGVYDPTTGPIVGDDGATRRVLGDFAAMPEPLIAMDGPTFYITWEGINHCRTAMWLERTVRGEDPSEAAAVVKMFPLKYSPALLRDPNAQKEQPDDSTDTPVLVDDGMAPPAPDDMTTSLPSAIARNATPIGMPPVPAPPSQPDADDDVRTVAVCPYCDGVFPQTVVIEAAGCVAPCAYCERDVLMPPLSSFVFHERYQ